MEDILASIKKVIAEEKELRTHVRPEERDEAEEDVLELDQVLAPPANIGPPLLDEDAAGVSRNALEQLQSVAAAAPAPAASVNPREDMVRDMLRPILKQWLDEHLAAMVDEHVKREISRITGRPV
jgi:cell pole-organizing protein PopZ